MVETCRRNEISDGYIRLVITRGPGDLGIDPRKCPRAEADRDRATDDADVRRRRRRAFGW